jgi:predicted small lipoprotein YifL
MYRFQTVTTFTEPSGNTDRTLRRLLVLLAVATVLAGCGLRDPGATPSPSSDTTAVTTPTSTTKLPTKPASDQKPVLVYLIRDGVLGVGGRQVLAPGGALLRAALEALVSGPSRADRSGGLTTEIPAGTELLGVSLTGVTATVDLSSAFDRQGRRLVVQRRVGQVVATATQFLNVRRVTFAVDGSPVTRLGGSFRVSPYVTRQDVERASPQVLVETVWPGAALTSPVRFAGTANTFEAVVLWQVERPDGSIVARGSTMATSGTGTRGTFDARLRLGDFTGQAVLVTGGSGGRDGPRSFDDEVHIPFTVRAEP